MPGYDGNGSYYDLVQKYNNGTGVNSYKDTFLQIAPLGFLRAGDVRYSDGILNSRASHGYYWSSKSSSADKSYRLDFDILTLNPRDDNGRGLGFSLRCLDR